MYYIHLMDNAVTEIIPDENSTFPGIPITQRYTSDFISRCITADDVSAIHAGMIYDPTTKTFSEPPVPESTPVPVPTPTPQPQSDPIGDLAETVSDLMVEVDKIKLGVTDK